MANKIGYVWIAFIIVGFSMISLSKIISDMETSIDQKSQTLSDNMKNYAGTVDSYRSDTSEFTQRTDETSSMAINDQNAQIEDRGSDSSGVLNAISKNIITRLLTELSNTIPGFSFVVNYLILPIVGATISILFLRFFWGENKI